MILRMRVLLAHGEHEGSNSMILSEASGAVGGEEGVMGLLKM